MQRVQSQRLLITMMTAVFLVACGQEKGKQAEHKTVAQYLHDLDAAEAAHKLYSSDPGKYTGNPDWTNVTAALSKIQFIDECWPKKDKDRFTTANTDHACLDAKGYKR